MEKTNCKNISYEYMVHVVVFLFVVFSGWWLGIHSLGLVENGPRYLWGSLYQFVALWGGIGGLMISVHWGGFKSLLGRAVSMLSLGLLFQSFGQSVYSYYNLFAHIEAPYPSMGDIGFFGSVVLYIYGVYLLAQVSGLRSFSVSKKYGWITFVIPLALLAVSYWFFLSGYEFDWTNPIKVFLDFGYPLGQAFYVGLALVSLLISGKFLGGIMKIPVLMLVVALISQYVADFNFLFQVSHGTWLVAGYGDFLYLFSYLLMSIGLILIGQAVGQLNVGD